MQTLVFEPLIPIALWASLAMAAVALLLVYMRSTYRRLSGATRPLVMGLMIAAVALPLVILLNPVWLERLPPPQGRPVVSILIDASASMKTLDGARNRTRYDVSTLLAEELADQLRGRYEVQTSTFANDLHLTDLEALKSRSPDGSYTDIATALRGSLQADCPQGQAVVLLSDGIHNANSDARVLESARMANALAAPVYTRVVGGATTVRDLAVEVRAPQELAFAGQRIPVRALLRQRGSSGARVRIGLWNAEKMLDSREVTLGSEGEVEVDFPVQQEEAGVYRYEVRVEPLAQEATIANNQCMYLLRVVDEPIRVLVLEGNPYWDTKFLMRTLATDQAIDLTSVVRMTEHRYLERKLARAKVAKGSNDAHDATGSPENASDPPLATEVADTSPLPAALETEVAATRPRPEAWRILPDGSSVLADPQSLSEYQVVVLGRDADVFLTDDAIAQLRRWLARGGGSLVCFRGSPSVQVNERMGQLLPVRWTATPESRFKMQLTTSGRDLRWISTAREGHDDAFAQLPSLATTATAADVQPQATIWAVAEAHGNEHPAPAVVALPYGTGRVVVIEGAGMWRWAFLSPQFQRQEEVYGGLWHSLIRWLVGNSGLLPTQTWSLRSDKLRFSTSEAATGTLVIRENKIPQPLPAVELQGGSLVAPQTFPLIPHGEEPGTFRVSFGRLGEGRYDARIAGSASSDPTAQAIFEVRGHVDELLELTSNTALMVQIAHVSGGESLSDVDGASIATRLDEHLAQTRTERVRRTTAWDRWWVLVGVFAVWTCTWGVRRRCGLV